MKINFQNFLEQKMETFGTSERSFAAYESIRLAKKFISERGLEIQTRIIGDLIQTTHCELLFKNVSISNGSGKGIGIQSEASALFEAIEHLFSIYSHIPKKMIVKKLDLDNEDSELDNGSPDFRLIGMNKELFFSRVLFKNILDESEELLHPYFLTDPSFKTPDAREFESLNYFSLLRYGTNSGTASGISADDAILHALLELIERDAIGIELLRTVISKNALPVRRLSDTCFNSNLIELLRSVKIETSGIVKIWDFTTDLGIPVCLAAIQIESGEHFFDSGASLSMEYAIERAILEALQYYHVGFIGLRPPQLLNSNKFSIYPNYQKCYLRKGIFEYRGGEKFFDRLNDYSIFESKFTSTKEQVNFIVNRLGNFGIKVFIRPILDDLVKVYQVVIPKLERFHLVSYGVPVTPGYRGNKVFKSDEKF